MKEPQDPFEDVTLVSASLENLCSVLHLDVIPSMLGVGDRAVDVLTIDLKVQRWDTGEVLDLTLAVPRSAREHLAREFINAHFLDEECRHEGGH